MSAQDRQLDILIQGADLVRIFDSIRASQDVYVQMQAVYDGFEKTVVRTPVAANGNLRPRWNERFVCGRGGGAKAIKFQIYIKHTIRSPTLAGEVEYTLDSIWDFATQGYQQLAPPIMKGNEQTGILHLTVGLQGGNENSAAQPLPQAAPRLAQQAAQTVLPGYGQQGRTAAPQFRGDQPRYAAEQPRDAGVQQGYAGQQGLQAGRTQRDGATRPYAPQVPAQVPRQQQQQPSTGLLANGWDPNTPITLPGVNIAAPVVATVGRQPQVLVQQAGAMPAAMGAVPLGSQQGDWWNSFLARG